MDKSVLVRGSSIINLSLKYSRSRFYFCINLVGLLEAVGIGCGPNERFLLIDMPSRHLKAVKTKYLSFQLAHFKKAYSGIKSMLDAMKYDGGPMVLSDILECWQI